MFLLNVDVHFLLPSAFRISLMHGHGLLKIVYIYNIYFYIYI